MFENLNKIEISIDLDAETAEAVQEVSAIVWDLPIDVCENEELVEKLTQMLNIARRNAFTHGVATAAQILAK